MFIRKNYAVLAILLGASTLMTPAIFAHDPVVSPVCKAEAMLKVLPKGSKVFSPSLTNLLIGTNELYVFAKTAVLLSIPLCVVAGVYNAVKKEKSFLKAGAWLGLAGLLAFAGCYLPENLNYNMYLVPEIA